LQGNWGGHLGNPALVHIANQNQRRLFIARGQQAFKNLINYYYGYDQVFGIFYGGSKKGCVPSI
jgi:hypothetical protein